jgi:hypothetical protein
LELLSEYAAHEANLNLALRFDQVRSMKADLGLEAITQLADWNRTNELDREIVLGQLIRSKGKDTPIKLLRIQNALDDLKKQTQDPDIRDRTYSLFVCDAQGIQIARAPIRDTIGTDFAFRSYFTGRSKDGVEGTSPDRVWPNLSEEPRLSASFLTRNGDDGVIAVSAPIWHDGEFQGVYGIFIELGDLVRDPETAEATDKMLIFDVRQGPEHARLIHNQGQKMQDIEPIDLSPYLPSGDLSSAEDGKHPISSKGGRRIATKQFKQSSDPERGRFVVMMVEEAATIKAPGNRLRANLVIIGLSVVGFAALVLSVIWVIILQRVVKT